MPVWHASLLHMKWLACLRVVSMLSAASSNLLEASLLSTLFLYVQGGRGVDPRQLPALPLLHAWQ
jgi:hypothetical protein